MFFVQLHAWIFKEKRYRMATLFPLIKVGQKKKYFVNPLIVWLEMLCSCSRKVLILYKGFATISNNLYGVVIKIAANTYWSCKHQLINRQGIRQLWSQNGTKYLFICNDISLRSNQLNLLQYACVCEVLRKYSVYLKFMCRNLRHNFKKGILFVLDFY